MPVYMVERVLLGATLQSVKLLRTAAEETCRVYARNGKTVRYLRSTFTPGESRCRCLFEAADSEIVRAVNDAAQIPYSRIILAVDFPGEASARTPREEHPDTRH